MMREFPKLDANAVRVYGASDDLIEVEGGERLDDEFAGGYKSRFVGFTDGTVLRIRYGANDEGFWRIDRVVEGKARYEHEPATDEEQNYSDVAVLRWDQPFTRVVCRNSVKAANIGVAEKDPRYDTLRGFALWMGEKYDEVECSATACMEMVDEYLTEAS